MLANLNTLTRQLIEQNNKLSISKLFASSVDYADAGDSADQTRIFATMERCISDIRSWMLNDKLMSVNDDKTELICLAQSGNYLKSTHTVLKLAM